ncbi:MAG: DUF6763 family protein [Steroidobacteraceae bacterium]
MASPRPIVGHWYRMEGGLFEVVAIDDDDATVEIQYFDGTVEEMDLEDWEAHCEEHTLETADAPEDWRGSVDVESDESSRSGPRGDEPELKAQTLEGIDIFEAR